MIAETELAPALAEETAPALDAQHLGTNGINIGGNTVTQATEHLPEHARLLIRWLHTHARNLDWSWDELVKAVGFSSTTWYRIWTDKFRYPKGGANAGERMPVDKQAQAIARYKKVFEQRELVKQSGFVETSVWRRVDFLCRRAFVRQRIGFIYGESQIGKTTCLQHHAELNNHGQTAYVELPPSAGVQLMTRHIARALHVSDATCFERLLNDVVDALDASKLLIVDEIHRVFTTYQKTSVMRCLDVLRYLHDRTHCGMVLCGTNVFKSQLQQGQFSQYLKQLRRRGLYELQLPAVPPEDDLELMAEKFGLPAPEGDAKEIVDAIARSDGFGKYIIRLQDAAELAAHKREMITWEHFKKAHHLIEKMSKE